MTAKKPEKAAPALALDLPVRPPSKVEQGLAAAEESTTGTSGPGVNVTVSGDDDPVATVTGGQSPQEIAIEAMVAAGISRQVAEATFLLAEEGSGTAGDAAQVAEAVAELVAEDHGQPICRECFGPWDSVNPKFDAVSCEHAPDGGWRRRPAEQG